MATAGGSGASGAAQPERLSADQLRGYLLTWGVDVDRVEQHSLRLAQIGVTLKGLAAVPQDVLLSLLIGKGVKATERDDYDAYVIMAGAREAAAAAGSAGAGAGAGQSGTEGLSLAMQDAVQKAAAAAAAAGYADLKSQVEDLQQIAFRKPGSATYSKTYNQLPPSKRFKLDSPPTPETSNAPPFPSQPMSVVNTREDTVLLPRVFAMLSSMPGAVETTVRELQAVSYNGIVYVNTSKLRYLDGTAPDITILQEGYGLHASTVLAVIELQTKPLDNHHRGKMWCYLAELLRAVPGRALVKGMLFNGCDVELYQAKMLSASPGIELETSDPLVLASTGGRNNETAWKQLWMFLLSGGAQHTGLGAEERLRQQYGWKLPHLYAYADNANSRLQLIGLLGCSRAVYVWEAQRAAHETAVCKHYCGLERASSYFREKAALEAIRDARCEADKEQGRSVWPKLLSANDQQHVLVTQPVVKQMDYLTTLPLQQLFAGIRFLHNVANQVHRDLEDKHVGLAGSNCGVIDLSTCVALGTQGGSGYSGTIINASNDVLDGLCEDGGAGVEVRRQQDLVALVKTVYSLTHPHRRPHIHAAARQVATDLERAGSDAAARSTAVAKVRNFWSLEFDESKPNGKRWHDLVEVAHVDVQSGRSYEDVMSHLETELLKHACCR